MTTSSSDAAQSPPDRGRSGGGGGRALGALAVSVAGLVLWLVCLMAIGRAAESTCVDDLEQASAYGAYSQSGQLVPPEFSCTLRPVDSDRDPVLVVEHPVFATIRLLLTVGVPVITLALTVAVLARRGPGVGRTGGD